MLDLFFVAPALATSGLRALDGVASVHWIALEDLDPTFVANVRPGDIILVTTADTTRCKGPFELEVTGFLPPAYALLETLLVIILVLVVSAKYKSTLDWEGKVVQSCVHCHQIGDAFRAWRRSRELQQGAPAKLRLLAELLARLDDGTALVAFAASMSWGVSSASATRDNVCRSKRSRISPVRSHSNRRTKKSRTVDAAFSIPLTTT